MTKKHDTLGCSTCSLEQLVTFVCLKPGMETIWCYCRRPWRETVAQRRAELKGRMNTSFDSETRRNYFVSRIAEEFMKNTQLPLED